MSVRAQRKRNSTQIWFIGAEITNACVSPSGPLYLVWWFDPVCVLLCALPSSELLCVSSLSTRAGTESPSADTEQYKPKTCLEAGVWPLWMKYQLLGSVDCPFTGLGMAIST